MCVITVSREFGSEGDVIGQQAAKSLGYSLVTKELIERVLNQYGMSHIDTVYRQKHNVWERYDDTYTALVDFLGRTLLAFASLDNCVILGRGGYAVLGEYPNVLNVCIRSPFDKRVQNVLNDKMAEDYARAEKMVRDQDEARRSFCGRFIPQTAMSTNCSAWSSIRTGSFPVPRSDGLLKPPGT